MPHIRKRTVVHFSGFEPLDGAAHRRRYERSARQSGQAWNCTFDVADAEDPVSAGNFTITGEGESWRTRTQLHVIDHNGLIATLRALPLPVQLARGYGAALQVIAGGGLSGYFRHAWRFALFFLFPFLLMALGLAAMLAVAAAPLGVGLPGWHLFWSVPLALVLFTRLFLPFTDRFHTLHLFANWRLTVALARLDQREHAWIDAAAARLRDAFHDDADEFLVTAHSMGATLAAHALGRLLETQADVFAGKRVVFVTMGGAVLQSALLRPASGLRARVGLIARASGIDWLDVQCLTDSIHFYKSSVVAACGHPQAPAAQVIFVRFKHMLTAPHYARIKRDFLRVHRQYVLGPDRRAAFDFTLMTAGPLPALSFAGFSQDRLASLPPDCPPPEA